MKRFFGRHKSALTSTTTPLLRGTVPAPGQAPVVDVESEIRENSSALSTPIKKKKRSNKHHNLQPRDAVARGEKRENSSGGRGKEKEQENGLVLRKNMNGEAELSMVNLGVASINASTTGLLSRDSLDDSLVGKRFFIQDSFLVSPILAPYLMSIN